MPFPNHRHRRLRKSEGIRELIAETSLSPQDFLVPLFVMDGSNQREAITSMPGYCRYSMDAVLREVEECMNLGLIGFLLFARINANLKDNEGKEAINENGLFPQAIQKVKDKFPEAVIFSDVALDPYSIYGHDGIVEGTKILNDPTLEVLAKMALLHASAGVDFVAPSDMMDGRVGAIRQALDAEGFSDVGIMSYAAKYASSFYGPFREALDSAPGFGDKSGYQMDPRNAMEAIKECRSDVAEGADMLMIKPAMPYLDVIAECKREFNLPIAAYQVSGEYSMIKMASDSGIFDEQKLILETLYGIKRAGAKLIASYFAKSAATYLNEM